MFRFKLTKHLKRCRATMRAALAGNRPAEGKGVRILMYHSVGGRPEDHRLAIRVPSENFEKGLDHIVRSGYRTFTISELVAGGLKALPEKALAITFDDGYKDNMAIAAPNLRERGLRATFFITTSYVERTVEKRWRDGRVREFMSWDDIARLSGWGFEIGSHMAHHADLAALPEERMRFELESSRAAISDHIGKSVDVFSYPYGGVNGKVIEIAKACGYRAGCSSFCGWNTASTNPYLLKRTEIDAYDIIHDLALKLYGYYD